MILLILSLSWSGTRKEQQMNDILKEKWSNLQEEFRKLNIVAGVDWDTTTDGRYITNVYIYQDVKLRPFHGETHNLTELLDNLEGYYEVAKRKNRQQKSLDILNRLDWAFMHLIVYGVTFTVCMGASLILYMAYDSGILGQLIEMSK